MTSGRKQLLMVALAVLPIGAGVIAGMVAARMPAGNVTNPSPGEIHGDGLSEQLGLSDAQAQQMRGIWETVRDQVRTSYQDAEKLQRSRDEELVALLNQEQKAKFERISQAYSDRFQELRRKRDQSFAKAVEQTRGMLSAEQRAKYDELLRTHVRPDQLGGPVSPADIIGTATTASDASSGGSGTTTRPAG